MEATTPQLVARQEIRRIVKLKRNNGAISEIARRAGVAGASVSLWLSGKHASQKIWETAAELYHEILANGHFESTKIDMRFRANRVEAREFPEASNS